MHAGADHALRLRLEARAQLGRHRARQRIADARDRRRRAMPPEDPRAHRGAAAEDGRLPSLIVADGLPLIRARTAPRLSGVDRIPWPARWPRACSALQQRPVGQCVALIRDDARLVRRDVRPRRPRRGRRDADARRFMRSSASSPCPRRARPRAMAPAEQYLLNSQMIVVPQLFASVTFSGTKSRCTMPSRDCARGGQHGRAFILPAGGGSARVGNMGCCRGSNKSCTSCAACDSKR